MRTFIQDKKCISLVYGPDKEYPHKRFLKWVLESINILQKLVSKVWYIELIILEQMYDLICNIEEIII